jgi:hypothetical protein
LKDTLPVNVTRPVWLTGSYHPSLKAKSKSYVNGTDVPGRTLGGSLVAPSQVAVPSPELMYWMNDSRGCQVIAAAVRSIAVAGRASAAGPPEAVVDRQLGAAGVLGVEPPPEVGAVVVPPPLPAVVVDPPEPLVVVEPPLPPLDALVTTSVPRIPLGVLLSRSAFLMALAPALVTFTFVPLTAKTGTVDVPPFARQRAAVSVTERVPFLSFSPPWRLPADESGKATLPPPAFAGATAATFTPADVSALAGVNVAVDVVAAPAVAGSAQAATAAHARSREIIGAPGLV